MALFQTAWQFYLLSHVYANSINLYKFACFTFLKLFQNGKGLDIGGWSWKMIFFWFLGFSILFCWKSASLRILEKESLEFLRAAALKCAATVIKKFNTNLFYFCIDFRPGNCKKSTTPANLSSAFEASKRLKTGGVKACGQMNIQVVLCLNLINIGHLFSPKGN